MKVLSRINNSISGIVQKVKNFFSPKARSANKKRKVYFEKIMTRVQRHPVITFGVLILVLLVLIISSNLINKPEESAEETAIPAKEVQVYSVGTTPKITVQAVVEKSGVIKVISLGSGIVQNINVEAGQDVIKGTNLISMSTNYQGGNAFSVQRQLAQVQYKNVLDTYNTQKDIIGKQKELANKSDENTDKLREISNNSVSSTQSLIDLNNQILSSLEAQQAELESTNVGGANDAAILQIKQLRSQLMAGNTQLQQGLNNTQYLGSDTNPPAQISDISREIAIKQLDLQEKALELNKEVSRLSVVLAQINEAIMFPSSPVSGVVERVFVREGQALSPGTPIAQISGNSESLIAVALLSHETSHAISRSIVSTLYIGNETFESVPFYVSQDATDGALYSAQFAIPDEFASKVTDRGYILIEIPIDFPKTGSTIPFIPIDSVFQTQDEAFVFVAKDGKAVSKKVKLGSVVGRFVEVKEGLSEGDQVIINRNVISGDPVKLVTSD